MDAAGNTPQKPGGGGVNDTDTAQEPDKKAIKYNTTRRGQQHTKRKDNRKGGGGKKESKVKPRFSKEAEAEAEDKQQRDGLARVTFRLPG